VQRLQLLEKNNHLHNWKENNR